MNSISIKRTAYFLQWLVAHQGPEALEYFLFLDRAASRVEVTTTLGHVTRLVYVCGVAQLGEPVLVVGALLPGGALLAPLAPPSPRPSSGLQQQQEQRPEKLHISFTTSPQESHFIATTTTLLVVMNNNIG